MEEKDKNLNQSLPMLITNAVSFCVFQGDEEGPR